MKFFCCMPARPGSVDGPPHLIIEAATAFDAKHYAQRELGSEGLIVHQTGADATASVELQWVGTDAGEHPNRHLQVRCRTLLTKAGVWGDWRRA
jgi:hypothetical protein